MEEKLSTPKPGAQAGGTLGHIELVWQLGKGYELWVLPGSRDPAAAATAHSPRFPLPPSCLGLRGTFLRAQDTFPLPLIQGEELGSEAKWVAGAYQVAL